ncbi:MAG: cell division protein FtsQ/DivIB [Marinosulfonomonas sp.]|nr:cell division protein FtsQ/DivIB [Marinosulfonomonas sp.]
MQPLKPSRRDPAPSRVAYRLQRLWLTPVFRIFMRAGLPVALVVGLIGGYFSQPENREAVYGKFAELRRSIEERPEFMVKLMAIDGATPSIGDDIREIVPVDFPVSSFDLDLPGIHDRIAELDAVERVDVRIRAGGILQVQIIERTPAAVWRVGQDLELLDAVGHRVAVISSRLERADLPLLAGEGAEKHVPEALALLAAAEPVRGRVRGLVRIGSRRWDVVLDREQRILLPDQNPIPAFEQVMALVQARDLLERDIIVVDMRNQNRPTLRMGRPAIAEMRRIRAAHPGAYRE